MFTRRANTTANVVIAVAIVAAIVVAVAAVLRMDTWGERADDHRRDMPNPLEPPKIDPALIKYRQTGSIPLSAERVRGLAVAPDGRLFVAGDSSLAILSPRGAIIEELALDGEPQCLAIGGEDHARPGQVYVGMKDHVEVFDAKGKRLAAWKTLGEKAQITCIAASVDDVFLADVGNRIVWRYDTNGKLLGRIGDPDKLRKIRGFVITSHYFDLTVSPDGLLRVVNPRALRIEAYTFDGDLEAFWGKASQEIEGFFGCCNPAHLAVLSDGRFVTAEKGIARVKVYGPGGKFDCVVAGPEQLKLRGDDVVADLAVDAEDRILVLDPSAKSIRIFQPKPEESKP